MHQFRFGKIRLWSFQNNFYFKGNHKMGAVKLNICISCRYGESRGPWAGRTGLPHALPPGLPRVPPWDDEAVLEEGARWKADLWIHPVLFGRLLHSHRAAVPARGQPLDWGGFGGGANPGITQRHQWRSKLRTTESFNKWDKALRRLQRKRFLCYKLVHDHTGISARARRKCFQT